MDHYLGKISMKTGIAKEVLAEQARVKSRAVSGRQPPSPSRTRPVFRQSAKTADSAESLLASLLAGGSLPEGMVQASDFEDPLVRPIAEALLSGKKPAEILGMLDGEDERRLASSLFGRMTDMDPEQAIQAADDCLQTIRVEKLNQKIAKLAEDVKTQEGSQQTVTLHLIQELQLELVRLRQSWNGR